METFAYGKYVIKIASDSIKTKKTFILQNDD